MPTDLLITNLPFAKYYLFALIMLVPLLQIFRRAGFRPYWALPLGIPDIGIFVCLVVLALKKWPKGA